MGELRNLKNIGPEMERQLIQAGISTEAELRAVGSREAWLRILAFDPSACIMRLNGLEGAIQGVRLNGLDDGAKAELREFYYKHKRK